MDDELRLQLYRELVDSIEVGVFAVDHSFNVILWNRYMAVHSGRPANDVVGGNLFEVFPELPRKWLERKIESVFILKNYAFTSWEQRPYLFRFPHNRPITGGIDAMRQNATFLPVKGKDNEVHYVCVTIADYTDTAVIHLRLTELIGELEHEKLEQQRPIHRLEEAHNQLLQSEKLASIGQLAAGVAHEINNPIGFVQSNVGSLNRYVSGMLRLLDAYEKAASAPEAPDRWKQVAAISKEIDYEYIRDDVPALISESTEGLDRVRKIVQDLKDFSRVGASDWEWANIHHCLDSTLNIVWNELKYKAEVVKDYGSLPDVECMPSQINQVFMNLLVNAAQAIPSRGVITLRTTCTEDSVSVEVSDSGQGIPPENLSRIFDPFFTTKPVGTGTGLGLSVTYSIVQRHHGQIDVTSEVGAGTTFRITLPLRQPKEEEAAA